jgi:hypothetical protein
LFWALACDALACHAATPAVVVEQLAFLKKLFSALRELLFFIT